ncbi:opacity family porin [Bergeriella denitrificans]|uniref:Outer membrane protein n=1 Tax=Bergeriella denitrificans TaxID=494 RepID=A0A378UH36_BERDE|nr:opacity family porin [Bergeriella denitrificans]STZ76688.1 outer membrane protein [Bergeriella denitrificans]
MKKLLLTAVLAGLSGAAAANGWYVQGDVGASRLEAKNDTGKVKDTKPTGRVSVGKDFGAARVAADYTYMGKVKNSESGDNFSHNAEVSAHSVGVSGIYDFHNASALTPYVGARVGLNRLDIDTRTVVGNSSASASEDKTQIGIGALAGAQYQLTNNLAANAGIEYNYLGKVADAKVHQYGVNAGLRYNF